MKVRLDSGTHKIWLRLALLVGSLACMVLTYAEPSEIQGTRVTLVVPDNFTPSKYFPGFQHNDVTAAIVVNEIPSSFIEFARQYSDAGLQKSKMNLISREFIDKDGLSGELLLVRQTIRGKTYERWIMITGDTTESVMIAGYYPADKRSTFRRTIEQTLRDALWDSSRELDHFDGLGFRIDDVPSLRVVTRMSNSLIFTETGRLPDLYYTDALLMMSLKPVDGIELTESFALDQFRRITLLEERELDVIQSKQIARLPGVVVEGTGRHRHLGYDVAVMQVIIETDAGFFVAQGFTNIDDMENDFDVFRATIGSFRLESLEDSS